MQATKWPHAQAAKRGLPREAIDANAEAQALAAVFDFLKTNGSTDAYLCALVSFAPCVPSKGDEQGVVVIWPDHWGIIATPIILGRRRFSLKEPGELEALAQYFAPSDSP
jgi:hypothetical protein